VRDAATFAKVAGDEMNRLSRSGGTFELKVQAGDSDPRTFAAPIKAPAPEPAPGARTPTAPSGRGSGSGGVNVWDRFDKGARGRDDPTQ